MKNYSAVWMAGILVLAVCINCPAKPAAATATAATSTAAPVKTRIWIQQDIDLEARDRVADALVQRAGVSVSEVSVSFFGGQGALDWDGKISTFHFMPFDPASVHLTLEGQVFPQQRAREIEAARQAHQTGIEKEAGNLRRYLRSVKVARSSTCVSLTNLAARLMDERRDRNLVVTAGSPCGEFLRMRHPTAPKMPSVVVLMLPGAGERGGRSDYAKFAKRESDLNKVFPEAAIFRPYELEKVVSALTGPEDQNESRHAQIIVVKQRTSRAVPVSAGDLQSGPVDPPVNVQLMVRTPAQHEAVPEDLRIEGSGSTGGMLLSVVHPLGTGTYWVQAPGEPRADGTFVVGAVIGRGGNIDCDRPFEVRVFQNPREKLVIGQQLSGWPSAEAASISVLVKRGCGQV